MPKFSKVWANDCVFAVTAVELLAHSNCMSAAKKTLANYLVPKPCKQGMPDFWSHSSLAKLFSTDDITHLIQLLHGWMSAVPQVQAPTCKPCCAATAAAVKELLLLLTHSCLQQVPSTPAAAALLLCCPG